jgi:4-amino-4-deoxychorismate lyase
MRFILLGGAKVPSTRTPIRGQGARVVTGEGQERKRGTMDDMSQTALAILNQPSADVPPHQPGAAPFELVDPTIPHLSVLDLGVTRGDGIFDAFSVSGGHGHSIDPHLRRFAASAAKLDLPAPDLAAWRAAIDAVITQLDELPEATVKVVMTRGIEGDPEARPTGWVYGWPAADHGAARTSGIRVVTLDRGYRHDAEQASPWLLLGAKSLSYAVNKAVMREAARRGADDVIFVSSDGFVLEGPSSSVLFRRDNTLWTPGTGIGILDGTTQGDLFAWASAQGMETGFQLLTPTELATADAIWLVSSGRHVAPVRALDGVARDIDSELTEKMNAWLLSRVS